MQPFSVAVLTQVERLGGTWTPVPSGATALARVAAIRFPHPLLSPEDAALVDAGAPIEDARTTGHAWQGGDILYQWESGLGREFPFVDLGAAGGAELAAFRTAVADPAASGAVLLTSSEGYPNYLFVSASDPAPDDPAVYATDHEGFFRHIEPIAPTLSAWLSEQLTDAELAALLRG